LVFSLSVAYIFTFIFLLKLASKLKYIYMIACMFFLQRCE
jgi:hypothetical protein